MKAKLHVDPQAKPLFYKARTVPLALREKVEQELERLEKQDIITPVIYMTHYITPCIRTLQQYPVHITITKYSYYI